MTGTAIKNLREKKGLSQEELAQKLGVSKLTILRWEKNFTRPSALARQRISEYLQNQEINISNAIQKKANHVEASAKEFKKIKLQNKEFKFIPSPYVIWGPSNQSQFFNELFSLQSLDELPCSISEYSRRLSCVEYVDETGESTAQYRLERPKKNAEHWNPNYGLHGIHRYVGRFPPQLVRALLNHFGARPGDLVCDPFAGSGTTLLESRLLGLRAIGIEICPLSALISRTKALFPLGSGKLKALSASLNTFYLSKWKMSWHGSRTTHKNILSRQGNLIPEFSNYEKWMTPEALLGCSIIVEFARQLKGYEKDVLCCALSSKMRSIGNVDVDVVRAEYSKTPRENVDVLDIVQRTLKKITNAIENSIESHNGLMGEASNIKILNSSLLDANIPSKSVNYIITSPPYGVESLSYLRTHLLSYRCLQPILNYDPYYLDKKFIGSEYLPKRGTTLEEWAPSKLSATFDTFFKRLFKRDDFKTMEHRIHTMMHFFNDMVKTAQAFAEWLTDRGCVAFVIGNKRIGDCVIPTHEIISDIFSKSGFRLEKTISHKLKCNNSNSEVPWQERIIQDEYILIFRKK